MSSVASIDLSRGSAGSDTKPAGMPATEQALAHRRAYRDAVAALTDAGKVIGWPDHYLEVVEFVVLEEYGVEAIALHVAPYRDRGKAIAVTLERLRAGLGVLAVHFRIGGLDRVRTRMARSFHESGVRPQGDADRRRRIRETVLEGDANAVLAATRETLQREAQRLEEARERGQHHEKPNAGVTRTLRRHRSLAGM
jgi:hypothetical protein